MPSQFYTQSGKFCTKCSEMCCDPSVIVFDILDETTTDGRPTANFAFEVCGTPNTTITCEDVVVGFTGDTEDWKSPPVARQAMVIHPGQIQLDASGKGTWPNDYENEGLAVIELPSRNICGDISASIVIEKCSDG
jgi:hypothetical protein